jgi:hypothetical protein
MRHGSGSFGRGGLVGRDGEARLPLVAAGSGWFGFHAGAWFVVNAPFLILPIFGRR